MAVEARELDQGRGTLVVGPRGRALFRSKRPGLMSAVAEGRLTADMADPMLGEYTKAAASADRLVVFFDASQVTGADSRLIETAGEWVLRHHSPVVTHALVRSRLLELSVSMMNLATRRPTVELYTDRAKLLAVAQREWPGFTLPALPVDGA